MIFHFFKGKISKGKLKDAKSKIYEVYQDKIPGTILFIFLANNVLKYYHFDFLKCSELYFLDCSKLLSKNNEWIKNMYKSRCTKKFFHCHDNKSNSWETQAVHRLIRKNFFGLQCCPVYFLSFKGFGNLFVKHGFSPFLDFLNIPL